MREILFRGKEPLPKNLPNVKIWAYGQLVQRDDYCCIFEGEDVVHPSDYPYLNSEIGWIDGRLTPIIPETVGQYTGLKDKNGKKIFEGDILAERSYRYHVYWSEDQCAFCVQQKLDPEWFDDVLCNFHPSTIEVIGNIHDNPELLKGE